MKQMADDSKERLNEMVVEGEAGNGLICIELTGNRELRKVSIHTDHALITKEDLEDLIAVALNRALKKANELNEQEVLHSAKNMFPGL